MTITPKNPKRYTAAIEIAKAILTKAHAERLMEWQEETVYKVLKERQYEWDKKAEMWVLSDADASDLPRAYYDHMPESQYEVRISARPDKIPAILASLQDRLVTFSKPYKSRHTSHVRVYAVCNIQPPTVPVQVYIVSDVAKVFTFSQTRLLILLPSGEGRRVYIRREDQQVMSFQCYLGDVVAPSFLECIQQETLWFPGGVRHVKAKVVAALAGEYQIHCTIDGWPMLFWAELSRKYGSPQANIEKIQQTGHCDIWFTWQGQSRPITIYATPSEEA